MSGKFIQGGIIKDCAGGTVFNLEACGCIFPSQAGASVGGGGGADLSNLLSGGNNMALQNPLAAFSGGLSGGSSGESGLQSLLLSGAGSGGDLSSLIAGGAGTGDLSSLISGGAGTGMGGAAGLGALLGTGESSSSSELGGLSALLAGGGSSSSSGGGLGDLLLGGTGGNSVTSGGLGSQLGGGGGLAGLLSASSGGGGGLGDLLGGGSAKSSGKYCGPKKSPRTLSNIYIFIAIALDESIFLDVLHFPMKNIMSRDLEAKTHPVTLLFTLDVGRESP